MYDTGLRVKKDYVTIATTRPETILGDTAVCVNPADKRYPASGRQKGYCSPGKPGGSDN